MELAESNRPSPPGVDRYIVGRPDDVPEGGRMIVKVGDREVGVFRVDGVFYAMLHRCPHLAGPLCLGDVIGLVVSDGPGDLRLDETKKFLTCPWHGWEFNLATGQSYWNPVSTRARPFPVDVREGGDLDGSELPTERVPGPYTAETMPIGVEDEYLVVSVRRARERSQADAKP